MCISRWAPESPGKVILRSRLPLHRILAPANTAIAVGHSGLRVIRAAEEGHLHGCLIPCAHGASARAHGVPHLVYGQG